MTQLYPTLQPTRDNILIEIIKDIEETLTVGKLNIVVQRDLGEVKYKKGKVISVGPGRTLECGVADVINLKPGDEVLLPTYAGTQVLFSSDPKEVHEMVKWSDVIARL